MLPATTGYAARLLGTREVRLNDLIRRGKINPLPPLMLGRRLWHVRHVLQAAEALGCLDDAVRARIEHEAPSEAVSQVLLENEEPPGATE